MSSQDGTRRHGLDGCSATRNRKVEGSNPSSGSITAGQRASLALLAAQRYQAVIPWVDHRAAGAAGPASLRRSAAHLPAGAVLDARRRNPGGNWVARPHREVDRGRHDLCRFAASPTFQRLEFTHLPISTGTITEDGSLPPAAGWRCSATSATAAGRRGRSQPRPAAGRQRRPDCGPLGWRSALAILRELDMPEATEVAGRLNPRTPAT